MLVSKFYWKLNLLQTCRLTITKLCKLYSMMFPETVSRHKLHILFLKFIPQIAFIPVAFKLFCFKNIAGLTS